MKRTSTQKTFWKKKEECPPLVEKKHISHFSHKTSFEFLSPQLPKLWPSLQKIPHEKVTPLGSWELKVPERLMIGMDGMGAKFLQIEIRLDCCIASFWLIFLMGHSLRICITFSTFCSFILLVKKKELLSCSFRQLFFFLGVGSGEYLHS